MALKIVKDQPEVAVDLSSSPDMTAMAVVEGPLDYMKVSNAAVLDGSNMGQTYIAGAGVVFDVHPKAQSLLEAAAPMVESESEVQAWAYELCQIEQKMRDLEFKELGERREELRKRILAGSDSWTPGKPMEVKTPLGIVQFSTPSKSFKVTDAAGLFDQLGKDAYLQIAKPGVTDLKKVLSEVELVKFGQETPGSRTMKVVLL